MTTTTATTTTPDLPIPAGAVWAEWQDLGTPDAYRAFNGSRRVIKGDGTKRGIGNDDIPVRIVGTQQPDGTVDRLMLVGPLHPDDPITVDQAAQLGLALLELAHEAQQMAKVDQQLDELAAQK